MPAPELWGSEESSWQGQGSPEERESWYRQHVPAGSSAGEWKNAAGEAEERKKADEHIFLLQRLAGQMILPERIKTP